MRNNFYHSIASFLSFVRSELNFIIFGSFDRNSLNSFEKKGNLFVHFLSFSLAVFLHEIYEPKVIETGMSGKNTSNEIMNVFSYLFIFVSLFLIGDIRQNRKKIDLISLRYHIRTLFVVFFYIVILYSMFVVANFIEYGFFYFSPFTPVFP